MEHSFYFEILTLNLALASLKKRKKISQSWCSFYQIFMTCKNQTNS